MTDVATLRRVYLFNHLTDERIAEISQALKPRDLAASEVLFNRGDAGNEMYIVESGKVAIFSPDPDRPGEEKSLRIFQPEDVLGEMAIIDHSPRSASARALEPSRVLALNETDFKRLVAADADFSLSVMEGLNDRIRYTTNFLSEVGHWVGRITKGEYNDQAFNKEVENWAQTVSTGEADKATAPGTKIKDDTMSVLAAEFAKMAAEVRQREETLRKEIAVLKVQIDDTRRKQEVQQITGSESFQSLKERAQQLRAQMREDE
jgi:CRP-like cAMP-binding protein